MIHFNKYGFAFLTLTAAGISMSAYGVKQDSAQLSEPDKGQHSIASGMREASSGESDLSEAQIDSLERVAFGNVRDLQEIVISADAPMIKVSGTNITYNVEEDPSASGSTVLDLLRKVPLVSVDGQDNISVKGNGDFKIYVNGRPDPMLSQNASVVLKAMPAEAVSSVELITDPGAKYDAEGSGAIINLITERKQSENGYNGSANLSVDNRQLQAGVNGAAKFNKLTLNAGVNYAYTYPGQRKAKVQDETIYYSDPTNHSLRAGGTNSQDMNFVGIDLGGSYDLSPNDLLTFSANYYDLNGHVDLTDQKTEMFSADDILQWSYARDSHLKLRYKGLTAQAAYQHEFGRKDNYLGVSYMFSFTNAGLPGKYTYTDAYNFTPDYIYEQTYNSRLSREHTFQIDWSDALNSHAKLEFGTKGIFRRNSAFGQNDGRNDMTEYVPIEDSKVDLRQPQDIYAVYGLYTATYGNLTAQAGVRYEHTRMGIRYSHESEKDFTTRLNDVVPNASISYSFSPAHSLSANYSMRISRPSIEQLNPYQMLLQDTRIVQGNPNLTSERVNKVNITYTNFGRKLGGSVSADYTDSDNAITNFSYIDGYRMVTTYANIGHNRTAALNLFLMWSPLNSLRFTLNASETYADMKANKDIDGMRLANHGFSTNIYLNGNWDLPQKFCLAAYGGWNSGSVNLMGKGGQYHYYGLSLSRTFLKDDSLKLTLNANNCFEKYTLYKNIVNGNGFRTTNNYYNPAWTVGVSLSWSFGKNSADVKSVNSSIINDDYSTSKSSVGAGVM